MVYFTFNNKPNGDKKFEEDLYKAIQHKQILLHMLPGETWKFHLGVYTLKDWPEDCTHEDFYEYFRKIYGLNGDWSSFYKFYQRRLLPIDHIDIRIQPKGRIPFGVIVIQHESMKNKIMEFLNTNIGDEHNGFRLWSTLGIGTKNHLARMVANDTNDCISRLNQTNHLLYVMTKRQGKYDLLGGHAKLSELMDTVEHFANGDTVQDHLWENILQLTNTKAFYREVAEELGLVAYPSGDIAEAHCYHGHKTNHKEFIWIRYVCEDNLPIKLIITA